MDAGPKYQSYTYFLIMGLAIMAHLTGLLNDVFISDSALYASIAKEMSLSNNFLDLTFGGRDWLDKPHFQFWITAISYKIFGINSFAYKFPAILFTFLALVYTYKLAKDLYNRETALIAVLILATAEHLVLSNNDVRAEPYLTGLIIASIYYYHLHIRGSGLLNLILASLFAAFAVMCKGLFSLIPIIGAVGGELLIKRNWKVVLSWRWLISIGLIILFISPELYALYQQFDSHPEKIIFGKTGVSGIRFFLWDSQFGRFFNTGPIQGTGDPFFFLHTLLWAFLPWALLMYYAVYRRIRENIPRLRKGREFYTISGIILTILLFSLSQFQLPHYSNIIFPLLAIITAGFIQKEQSKTEARFYAISQYTVIILIAAFILILQFIFRPAKITPLFIISCILTAVGLFFAWRVKMRIFYFSCLASILLNFYLNLTFYPELLEYQSGSKAAAFANQAYPGEKIKTLGVLPFTMHFHSDAKVSDFRSIESLLDATIGEEYILFTAEPYIDSLDLNQIDYKILEEFEHYHTTKLSGSFLNHKTRKDALRRNYLLRIRFNPIPADLK